MTKHLSRGKSASKAAIELQKLTDEVARLQNKLSIADHDYVESDKAVEAAEVALSAAGKVLIVKRLIWEEARDAVRVSASECDALRSALKYLEKSGGEK